jgi:hypothetical protein
LAITVSISGVSCAGFKVTPSTVTAARCSSLSLAITRFTCPRMRGQAVPHEAYTAVTTTTRPSSARRETGWPSWLISSRAGNASSPDSDCNDPSG